MSNPLIPVGQTKAVYVVSALGKDGERQPLAVFANEKNALRQVKLIGMSPPETKPRMDTVWMPAKDCGCPTPQGRMSEKKENPMTKKLTVALREVRRIESFTVWEKNNKQRGINESVHFHHRDLPLSGRSSVDNRFGGQVASAVGYNWLQGKTRRVTVYILKSDAPVFTATGVDGEAIVADVRAAVRECFKEHKYGGEELSGGKVTAIINA